MKSFATLSSVVLLAAGMGFASIASAGADRIAPTRDGRTIFNTPSTGESLYEVVVNPGVDPIEAASGDNPAVQPVTVSGDKTITVAAGAAGTATIEAENAVNLQVVSVTGMDAANCSAAGTTITCTYTDTSNGTIGTDYFTVELSYEFLGQTITERKTVSVTVEPAAASANS